MKTLPEMHAADMSKAKASQRGGVFRRRVRLDIVLFQYKLVHSIVSTGQGDGRMIGKKKRGPKRHKNFSMGGTSYGSRKQWASLKEKRQASGKIKGRRGRVLARH